MSIFNLIFLTVLVGSCVVLTEAQTFKYKQLTVDELKNSCRKNKVNLTELEKIHSNVENLLYESITPTKNPDALKKDKNCLGDSLQGLLRKEMWFVRRCLNGSIQLDNSTVQILIDESERKLCALSRLASYEEYLSEVCLNSERSEKCQLNVMKKHKMENTNEFANLGLSYTDKGRKAWIELFDCASGEVSKTCNEGQQKKHAQLTKEFIDNLKINRIRATMKLTPAEVAKLRS
ncbi:uncharacterized protein LOC122508387 [Leptopilina heterotoma]|uniref:uncharacterized protein LOC122508387 n=1 Tax=Leptopilina heterotoma TaxID=63436 RepID=UPI001CA7E09D|nr:uncharacterized protein LOC122508387 [Leptopilina heterotoma]